MQFASRLETIETSAIRELFKLLGEPGIISFAGGFPDASLFDIEGIRHATEQALSSVYVAGSLQYGATEGVPILKEQLAAYMHAKSMPVDRSGLIVTTGCQQALDSVAKCLISPGDKVLVEGPTFLAAIQCFKIYGADLHGVPVDADGVDVDALEAAIIEHQPTLIYLIPNFGNPSGAMLSLERRERIIAIASKYDVVVLEDDPYGELYFDQPPPPSLYSLALDAGVADQFVYCGSLSKVLSPGLRVGWMAAQADLLAKATMCKQFTDAHTSNLSQTIAALYMQSGRMANSVQHMREVYAKRASTMADLLTEKLGEKLAFARPVGGMFLWAKMLSDSFTAKQYAQKAVEQKVAFVPGAPFYANNPDLQTLRLSFATASETQIKTGIERLEAAWS